MLFIQINPKSHEVPSKFDLLPPELIYKIQAHKFGKGFFSGS